MSHFQMPSILDPRFKLDWCHEDELQDMRELLTTTWSASKTDKSTSPDATTAVSPPAKLP